ncbi:hypothetical protein ACSBR2_035812 [Camellia fascicularis]
MALSVVTFLVTKLSSMLDNELKLLGGVNREFVFIRDELESIRGFLRVADAMEETDLELQTWVKQVQDVARDIEDVLDEFMLRFARHHQRGICGSIYKIHYQIKNMKARHQIPSEIQDIKSRVVEIAERRKTYDHKHCTSEQGSSSSTTNMAINGGCYDRRGDAPLLEEADLVGIDKPKQQLLDWVIDGDSPLKVISVFGMGGLGKTTLVKKVYEDTEVKRHFQNHAWITVSQPFNIKEILKDLIQQLFDELKRPLPQRLETMDDNKMKSVLEEVLQESRYVLVLDDVWRIDAWNAIKIALPNCNCGSRVLLTTRIANIASTSCREFHGNIYEMKALSPEGSWILFCKKTFQEKDCPRHLIELSERILGRCEGLPLAIVAIAGVLASKDYNRVDEWELVNRSLGAEVEGGDMMKILLLSYNDLPYYLKSCFLYLSIFPEDHLIGWMSLIRLWVAEGFVEVKHGKTPEEVAEAYIYELLNRSLIQVAKRRRDGRIQSCRVHDLLREIIVSKSIDQNFLAITGAGNVSWLSKVRHLSIHNTLQNIPQGKCLSRLRSLFMFGVDDPLSECSISLMFNGGLRLLKVLNLSGASLKTFPNQIVKLFHLRYLSLRGTQVRVLPNSIGKLQNLETHGFKAPSKIGHLQSLQKLCYIEANYVSDNTILKEIGQLTQLRRLGIRKLRREDGVALCSSIEKLSNLRSLDITPTKEDEILNLQSLSRAPQFLQRLYLNGRLEKLPDWITSLYGLTTIFLRWSKLRDDPLESLQDLPNLCRFELVHAYEGEGLCFKAGKFQSLNQLGLTSLKGLRWVTVEESTMPRLENLLIADCKLVEELPFGIEHLSNLKHLELVDLSDELVSKLNPSIQGGEYCKITHIPTLWIAHSKYGCWEKYY